MAKTDDIDKAILARAHQPLPARAPVAPGARAYVAEAGARLAEGLREENQRLKAERMNGLLVLRLDPKRVRSTKFINRNERAFVDTDQSFLALKASLRKDKQETPIRVRPVSGDPAADYEVVFGHRRHRACLALDAEIEGGFPVLALLDSDASESRDLVLKMYRENELRENPSAYEKGLSFKQWLAEGLFDGQVQIAEAIGVSKMTVTKYIQIADLPAHVIEAFGDPREISLRWAQDLIKAITANPSRVQQAALRIAETSPRPAPAIIARELTTSADRDSRKRSSRDQSIKVDGRVTLRVQRREGRFSLKFYQLSPVAQREIAEELIELAERRARERLKGTS